MRLEEATLQPTNAVASAHPRYSARLLQPFVELMRESGKLPEATMTWLSALDPDQRVDICTVHSMLEAALTLTGDELLGLKAAERISMGDGGVFDFVTSSAPTLRAALEGAARYTRLVNEAMDFRFEVEGERVLARFDNGIQLPRAAEDFRTIGLIHNHGRVWPEGMLAETDVWFEHAPPRDERHQREYVRVLGTERVHFGAPFAGFGFPSRYLDQPLRTTDPRLHGVLRRYADGSLAALPKAESVSERVRRFVLEQLAGGNFSLEDTARQLGMSSRTLGRRLADEGTTYKNLVDDLRKSVALRHLAEHDTGLAEVALLAGFTETPSFYRAFRRWTRMTPNQYRWQHRSGLRGGRS